MPPSSTHVCSREYFPLIDDHLPRVHTLDRRLGRLLCCHPVALAELALSVNL